MLSFLTIVALGSSKPLAASGESAKITVTYHSNRNENDVRNRYERALLELALNLTNSQPEPDFILRPTYKNISHLRAMAAMRENRQPNYIRTFEYHPENIDKPYLVHGSIPVYLGVLGYRVCFVSPEAKEAVARASSIEHFQSFVIGQGMGWLDVKVLRASGMNVLETVNYDSLFKMVAINRVQLFCRGINEVLPELENHQDNDNLMVDESFAFYYPFPLVFFTNKENQTLLNRVERGLKIAYESGELVELWTHTYQQSIDFVELDKRRIIRLPNPEIEALPKLPRHYFYQPQ